MSLWRNASIPAAVIERRVARAITKALPDILLRRHPELRPVTPVVNRTRTSQRTLVLVQSP